MGLSIQERLKDLRVERDLTLEQLAKQTHLSKSVLEIPSCADRQRTWIFPCSWLSLKSMEMAQRQSKCRAQVGFAEKSKPAEGKKIGERQSWNR